MSRVDLRWPFLLLAVALAWPALDTAFLSDDVSILHWMVSWQESPGLWTRIGELFGSGLPVPSHYYRPLALVSYAVDYQVYGTWVSGWHITGFALHVLNALLLGAVATAFGFESRARATAVGLFALFPLAPEVSIWIAGRYDVLAVTGTLIATWGHLRATGFDRYRWLSLFGFLLGLSAKEAAMPTPAILVLISLLRPAPDLRFRIVRVAREAGPAIGLFFAYLGWRVFLFGDALKVYPGSAPTAWFGWSSLVDRLLALSTVPRQVFVDAPWAGALALSGLLLGLLLAGFASRNQQRMWVLTALVAMAAISLLALLPHLSGVLAHGEGGRFYYASAVWIALAVAPAVGCLPRMASALAVVLVLSQVPAQHHSLAQWRYAGETMAKLLPELEQRHDELAPAAVAFALIPDHIGPVPFGRNAQGGIVRPPLQSRDLLRRVVPTLPDDLIEWAGRIGSGEVVRMKPESVYPRLDAAYCFQPDSGRLMPLPSTPDFRDADAFARSWLLQAEALGCLID